MAENRSSGSAKKRSSNGAAKKKSAGSAKARPAGKSSSAAKASAKKQADLYIIRKRRITGIILLCLSILFTLIYFMPGENLWRGLHNGYRYIFGIPGITSPSLGSGGQGFVNLFHVAALSAKRYIAFI